MKCISKKQIGLALLCALPLVGFGTEDNAASMRWEPLSNLPFKDGVAGAFAGISGDALVVAGGANFPVPAGRDLWKVPKVWHDAVYVLPLEGAEWKTGMKLDRPIGYGAVVTTRKGIVCMGGNHGTNTFADCFLLRWDSVAETLEQLALPELSKPCAYGAAAAIGDKVYLSGGQEGSGLDSAMNNFWMLDLSATDTPDFQWVDLPAIPGPNRAFNLVLTQHNGFEPCIYVMSGRRQTVDGQMEFLNDVWEYAPSSGTWRRRADSPVCVMAGTGAAVGQSHLFILSGADGSLMAKAAQLKDAHPGFPKKAWAYHTITDTWIDAGKIPENQVTAAAIAHEGFIYLASGEIRPRVRTDTVWRIKPLSKRNGDFGAVDMTVLIGYLLAMVGVGCWFTRRNKNTNDFFRGGQQVPWWVAGCSIFATMLSSITFMAIPAKAFAQNWVFLLGSLMIPVVAPVAVYLALPFFRKIDATSAYEYLETRFNRPVRLFASGLFTVFHLFRMGIVLSLAGLALAAFTPLTPAQSVLIAGVLCIIYSTLGGLLAVVWTDTIQTFVLLSGAVLCFVLVVLKIDGGIIGIAQIAMADGKLHFANMDFSITSYSMAAVWVVVIGGLGQNISSYVGDQSVVQRYMSTSDSKTAARSIWTNAVMAAPASLLFFAMGTALYAFYKTNPALLDPTMKTDQIFPLFIATQVPVGIAGLIVAGIFAAAQSTISTSMNSTASAVVTDFLRPFNTFRNEQGYFRAGRFVNFVAGGAGTLLGLLFVNPAITSLFDSFLMVVGLFMGVLGGIFMLGMLTRRANGVGAMTGALGAVVLLLVLRAYTPVHWLLFAPIGVGASFIIGYGVSLLISNKRGTS